MIFKFLFSICSGILAALLVWCCAMFVSGEAYSFMLADEWPNDAFFTRLLMLFAFIIGVVMSIAAQD